MTQDRFLPFNYIINQRDSPYRLICGSYQITKAYWVEFDNYIDFYADDPAGINQSLYVNLHWYMNDSKLRYKLRINGGPTYINMGMDDIMQFLKEGWQYNHVFEQE